MDHLFIYCERLGGLFDILKSWFEDFGVNFSIKVLLVVRNITSKNEKICLLTENSTEMVLKGMVAA